MANNQNGHGNQDQSKQNTDVFDRSNLTRNQFLFWLGQRMHPNAPLYNMVHTFTIQGNIVVDAFQQAFQALIDGSDAMRTVFQEVDGVPQQYVLPELHYSTQYLDFSSENDPIASLETWLDKRRVKIFNLAECSFDSVLIKTAPTTYVWYLTQHHILTDVLSIALIYHRTAELYALALKDKLADAPSLPQYSDFIAQERAYRHSEKFAKADAFWRAKQSTALEPTNFYGKTLVKNEPLTQRVRCDLGPNRSRKLRELAQEKGIRSLNSDMSLFSIFAALLFTYLHRIGGQNRVALGTPFHNRASKTFKETIGLFINVYPIQTDIADDETFLSLIKKTMREMMSGLRYAHHNTGAPQFSGAYDVVLNYLTASFSKFNGLPSNLEWIHSGFGDSLHGLRLQIQDFEENGNFVLYFDLNDEIFDDNRRQWIVDHFLHIVDAFLADYQQPISQVSLLSDQEVQTRLIDFNKTEADFPSNKTVVQLFEAQVAKMPEAIAVQDGELALTYNDLDQQANQLAHWLQAQGIGADDLVSIFMKRSAEVIVAILGVLKAGGAYVPIDAAFPKDRLSHMLEDTRSAVIVTQAALINNLPDHNARLFCFNRDWDMVASQPKERPITDVSPNNLAYVIYTSGSTGKPKGTMIRHEGLTNYVTWAKKTYLHDEILNFPLFSSLSFDLTVTSIFVPLISGGSIVVYGEDNHIPGMEVLDILEDNLVEIIKLTPAHLALIKAADVRTSKVRKLIVGGEDFKTDLARTIDATFNHNIEIYNEYGPTEAVVGCMIHRFDPNRDIDASVPIGTPADNAQIYILDDNLQPVPTGVAGEMYIGGVGVARGYLNQDALTSERFLPISNFGWPMTDMSSSDHHSTITTSKLYKTGDQARWTADNRLEFLGRIDHQVKIRGARIELAEVEAVLLAHTLITDCVVDVIQFAQTADEGELLYCIKCGLPSTYPRITFDDDCVCSMCRSYDQVKDQVDRYFKTPDDLRKIVAKAKATKSGKYDCMMLLSGGKDSTYVLAQLVDMGLNPLVFSLDNGFISEGAKDNIRNIVNRLNLDLIFATTPAMPAIFKDSLKRHSNVCHGCFKTIYTLSMNVAREHGIKYIFTGLSRGQLFETRLNELFDQQLFEVDHMDQAIIEARKVYHRLEDAVSQNLDVQIFQDDAIFEAIQFVDFYRYTDVELDEIYAFLKAKIGWIKPPDTGRSTNCLINDAGIYIHKKERGYHNYALPYSWDVRLGHKTREAAMDELDDEINVADVKRMLAEVGYESQINHADRSEKRLAAYYVSETPLTASELRNYFAGKLPNYMTPSYFVHIPKLPLTANGKVDRAALPDPDETRPELDAEFVAPSSMVESKLAGIWTQALNVSRVGVHDNFFDLGGASVPAVQVIAQVAQTFKVELPLRSLFDAPTIAKLSEQIESALILEIERMSDEEAEQLLAQL